MPKKKYPLQPGETRTEAEQRIDGERRLAILSFIIEFSDKKGYAPSVRDIMPIAGLASSSTMYKVLSRMEKDKLIQVTQGVARSMRVLPKGLEMIS
jgi:SOS-response transcriptional repressor LexA